jgi:hydroxymethylglutaryl-CoA lyase
LAYMFARMGFDTGVDLDKAVDAAKFIGGVLGRATPGMVSRAPKWPHA